MHFIWAIANLTLPLMFNNVYTDISLQIVPLLCWLTAFVSRISGNKKALQAKQICSQGWEI